MRILKKILGLGEWEKIFPSIPDSVNDELTIFWEKQINLVKQILDNTDFSKYTQKALPELENLDIDVDSALSEYKTHLLLCLINKIHGSQNFIVPSEWADKIWHEHILDTRSYMDFCEKIFGGYLHHNPGLEKWSPAFNQAVIHTDKVKKSSSSTNSSSNWAGCSGWVSKTTSVDATCWASCWGCWGGCGG